MDSEVRGPAKQTKPESLYFAYGSNLRFDQMARRCPESRYLGIAWLHGYRWQINQRGYANVIPSPNDVVAGLCYLLRAEDEASLDIIEGVAIGSYEKEFLDVELLLPKAALVGRKVSEILSCELLRDSMQVEREVAAVGPGPRGDLISAKTGRGEVQQALVYASGRYTDEGDSREEYVDRMNLGIADALKLGIPEEYVQTYIRSYIPPR
jgi:gamma-glutamylcyclotransferase